MKRIVAGTVTTAALLLLVVTSCSHRQKGPSADAGIAAPHLWDLRPDVYLNGYAASLTGDPFTYHSPHPDVGTSLLSRATDHLMEVAWETAPVPDVLSTPTAVFVWMCGIQRGPPASHEFHLSIDGERAFTFTTLLDGTPEEWEIGNDRGARLGFRSVMTDRYDDLMGYMYLEVPRRSLTPGMPLVISVVGEQAGSNDWYMTFEHPVSQQVTLIPEPALVREEGDIHQLVRVDIEHLGQPSEAVITVDGREIGRLPVALGHQALNTSLPAVEVPTDITVEVAIAGYPTRERSFTLTPVEHREMYLLHHSHVDIGYTHVQDEVIEIQSENLEQAIELGRMTRDYPEGARFRWNSEVVWTIDEYLRRASPEEKEQLYEAIREGWIGIDALYANVLTGLCRPEELMRLFDTARNISHETGVTIDAAMIIDIPGYTWGLVPAMAQNGIRYFSIGTNTGHRIGSIIEELGDRPFWWEGPSGRERVLCWVAGRGYSWFHTGLGATAIRNRLQTGPLLSYLRELDDSGWPYEMVSFHYNIGSDNGPPDPELPDFVREWNERFVTPRLIISTTSEMMGEFERRYGDELPVMRGDLTGYWEDGAASSALETAMNRSSADRLVQAEALWAILSAQEISRTPPGVELLEISIDEKEFFDALIEYISETWRNVLLYSEHTWGSWDSISDPESEFTRQQWEYKREYALEADRRSRLILDLFLGESLVPTSDDVEENDPREVTAMDIFNTSSWDRTGMITIPADIPRAGDRVNDEEGAFLPSQRLRNGDLAVLVFSVPAFGARRITFVPGEPGILPHLIPGGVEVDGYTITDNQITFTIDGTTGTIASLLVEGIPTDLVDRSHGPGLNDYLYVVGRSPTNPERNGLVEITVTDRGPLVGSIEITSDAPGLDRLTRTVRLVARLGRIEIIDTLEKSRVYDPEGVHLVFPFNIPEPVIRIDAAWGHYQPGSGQLTGSNRNFFPVQQWVDISNDEFGVTWTSHDAPMMEIGEITTDPIAVGWFDEVLPSATLLSYVMNNYWETNFRAYQEGPVTFRYAIQPHTGFDAGAARRFGIETDQPLIAVPVASDAPLVEPLLTINSDAVVATSLSIASDGEGLLLRLFNTGEHPEYANLIFTTDSLADVYLSDLSGVRGRMLTEQPLIGPSGILTLYISF
ncbi:hypothetical protein ACFL6T_03230 [Candidatus Zixiibacteriota bacterium]